MKTDQEATCQVRLVSHYFMFGSSSDKVVDRHYFIRMKQHIP